MKAFLLAAGEGTRLRPLTFQTPKCLIPISGVPLLEIWFRLLERHGVTDVLINTHLLADRMEAFVRGLRTSIRTRLEHEPELLGSAGTVRRHRGFVQGESAFWIVYADSLTDLDLSSLLRFHRERKSLLTLGLFHTDVPRDSGIATLAPDGRITGFVEKPADPPGDLSNTGIMVASPDLVEEIPDRVPCDFSFHVLPRLVGRMHGLVMHDFFIDIGTWANYEKAQREWNDLKKKTGRGGHGKNA
jgi:mannose-1-phosphate guanylyltransferase